MVVVRGNLDNLQSSLDFFLKITSKSDIEDSSKMRKKFFDLFKSEDEYREENFLNFTEKVEDDYNINLNSNPVLYGDEIQFDNTQDLLWGSYMEEESKDDKSLLENEKYEINNKEDNLEKEKSYSREENKHFESKSPLDFLKNSNSIEEDTNDFDTNEEDDTFISWDSVGTEDEDEEDDTFASWDKLGTNEDEEDEYIEESDDEEDDVFSSWDNIGTDEDEEYIGSSVGTEEFDEDEDEEDDVFSSWDNLEDDSDDYIEQVESEDISENLEDDTISSSDSIQVEDENNNDEELDEFDESFILDDVVPEVKNKVENVVHKEIEEVNEIPKDLREFVKMYPNCEMSFALKYFSKKEITRQLSLGRVFKRKNRLLI